ncbi:MAG: ADP-ribosyltransferase [Pseudomonadota bacterium]
MAGIESNNSLSNLPGLPGGNQDVNNNNSSAESSKFLFGLKVVAVTVGAIALSPAIIAGGILGGIGYTCFKCGQAVSNFFKGNSGQNSQGQVNIQVQTNQSQQNSQGLQANQGTSATVNNQIQPQSGPVGNVVNNMPPQITLQISHGNLTPQEKGYLLQEARNGDFYNSLDDTGKTDFMNRARNLLNNPNAAEKMTGLSGTRLTLEEGVAINSYTSGDYERINDQIRREARGGGQMDTEYAQLKEKFESGLSKLPSIPAGTHVTRGSTLPQNVANQHKVNLPPIMTTGLYSTTADVSQTFQGNHFIEITVSENSKGKDISMFSDSPQEQEVAFPTMTQFNVTSRKIKDDNGNLVNYADDVAYQRDNFGMMGLAGGGAIGSSGPKIFLEMTEVEEVNIQLNNNNDNENSVSVSFGDLPDENDGLNSLPPLP